MKKRFAIVLASMMTLSTAVPAFANVTTSPNKESDRVAVSEDGKTITFQREKETKNIFNTAPSKTSPFKDVVGEDAEYVGAAYALGITSGMYGSTVFVGDSELTVEEVVTWLYRLEDGEDKNGRVIAKISEAYGYAQKPLAWAAGLGLIDYGISPKAKVTVSDVKEMVDKLGYKSNIVGSDDVVTRIRGLKIILDAVVGEVNKVN